MANKLMLAALLAGLSGAARAATPEIPKAVKLCQAQKAHFAADDWKKGPCISNGADIKGWVVDIAHSPRKAEDDDPANQCASWKSGKNKHFVELDEECNVLHAQ